MPTDWYRRRFCRPILLIGIGLLAGSGALAAADDPFPVARPETRAEALAWLSGPTSATVPCSTPSIQFARSIAPFAQSPAVGPALALLDGPVRLSSEESAMGPDGVPVRYTVHPATPDAISADDEDGNGRPDLLDGTLAGLAEARRLLVEELALAPPHLSDVVLLDLGERPGGYVSASLDRAARIRIVLPAAPAGGPAEARRAAIHQYAHAVALALSPSFPPPWAEAFAAWTGLTLDGNPGPGLTAAFGARLDQLHTGLVSNDPGLAAGNALWFAFLEQNYGRTAVRVAAEELARGLPVTTALDRAVRRISTDDLPAAFREFHLWSVLVGARADGHHFSFADRLADPTFGFSAEGLPALAVQATPPLAPLGATQFRLVPGTNEGGMSLRFEGDFAARWEADLLLVDERGLIRRVPLALSPENGGQRTVPLDGFVEALLLVRVLDSDDGAAHRFTFAAHREARFPFELDSIAAVPLEPPGSGVLVSWETSSEQQLLGFNVLREREDGGQTVAVNPVWVPALGDETLPTSYHYLDRTAREGIVYRYRVEGITTDGLTSRSDPVTAQPAGPR